MSYAPSTATGKQTAQQLADISRTLYERGWMPGTSGNISMRLPDDPDRALITASGRDKGELTAWDVVEVDALTGEASPSAQNRPSAETSIHAAVYRVTGARAVIHVHSPYATVVAHRAAASDAVTSVRVERFELLKGLGLKNPTFTDLPVFPNWPEVDRIADDVAAHLAADPEGPPGLLLADHGITTWGDSLGQAKNRLECLESLCQLLVISRTELHVSRA
ncbi:MULTISPECIES: methylthioribulose 1-phosphate dehydratase [unclassified Streptomyces]|uniref:methylthioribulose 1-phosphate dehydratase n=1 Tax=unclassified Streptomyces TaxID=2593676 RepID=UPI001587B116|nr:MULTISPECIES: methylthioribulose 1-phosphate dehydratase [unclassified Streptomyces]NUV68763.1 methylthioribulose 1-phosphate dehydratase [Streptomyces sp. CAI-121]NUV98728.1 methylthioribulose 1-phosphate dehydratase [Streptomyces sp. CAI 127]NUW14905.1 methylthioribulose 1-phosphate dehydratase [Streptomyces sp. CAI-68]